MNWADALNQLAASKELSLRKLAPLLGFRHVYVSEVARGIKPASPLLRVRILAALGHQFCRDDLMLVLPDDVADEIRRLTRKGKHGMFELSK